jgi:hypothetical protein
MNSATLTKSDDSFQPWHFFVLVSILLATVAVFLTRRATPEHLVLLSFTVAAAGLTAAAFYRMLLPLASPDAVLTDAPLTDRHKAALERDKMLTLRAIKDLEFDRAMGKLSQKDFDEMSARLRQRAMTLMKQLDEGASYAPVIEKELQVRLATIGVGAPKGTRDECACGTANDVDAVFCKKCGTRLRAS